MDGEFAWADDDELWGRPSRLGKEQVRAYQELLDEQKRCTVEEAKRVALGGLVARGWKAEAEHRRELARRLEQAERRDEEALRRAEGDKDVAASQGHGFDQAPDGVQHLRQQDAGAANLFSDAEGGSQQG
jgi:hypothetical protein